ncbi:DoxX family protein [Agrobacterium sp. a22-2]|uniref:DoxX family protein n=1 Tax=Agrobacterium sp. a22-2 TaxID=2283840 RepID=UPI00144860F9|nr:DoxX family protein [Agrobacterium sp. a22-2]NKN36057.1 DoxX family protein [Agrobacterium sp. a22-2]
MSLETTPNNRPIARLAAPILHVESLLASVPSSLPLLALRLALAVPFFKSGLTKWDGFLTLSPGAQFLFQEEFKLHILGNQFSYPFPLTMAAAAGTGELVLPVLLVLGFGTRFAALGLLLMTVVIQLTIPDGWANFHLPWAAMALALMVFGSGRIAIDPLVPPRKS